MNTYYLVPSAEYQQTKKRGFDEITEGIVTNPQLDEYQRAVALQESLNKFLNMKPTYDKHKVKAVVKEVLADMKPPTPQPQPRPQPKYPTPMKTILGTFLEHSYHLLLLPRSSLKRHTIQMTVTRKTARTSHRQGLRL